MTIIHEEADGTGASPIPDRRIKVTVNGDPVVAEVEPRLLLAHLLRYRHAADRDSHRVRHDQLRARARSWSTAGR